MAEPSSPQQTLPSQKTSGLRDWTILLYMAGDNGRLFETKLGPVALMAEMTSAGHADISEVQQVGTTDRVAVLAQFDTLGAGDTYRLEIRQGSTLQEDLIQTLPEANTGMPAELAKFIVWGMDRCPARNTMLVLWNHGLGWKDDDIYEAVRQNLPVDRGRRREREKNTAFFSSTARTTLQAVDDLAEDDPDRGILADDTSMDLLTNVEMSQALRIAQVAADEAQIDKLFAERRGMNAVVESSTPLDKARRRLSVIGMDACLMAMIEVGYQVRDYADVLVASQEVEPMNGWPYADIIGKLVHNPAMSPKDLGAVIVKDYIESYHGSDNPGVTLTAIDLQKANHTGQLVAAFSTAVANGYRQGDTKLQQAVKKASSAVNDLFEDNEYVDLAEFVKRLLAFYEANPTSLSSVYSQIKANGQSLLAWLSAPDGPIVRNGATGRYQGRAAGLSIYLPQKRISPHYRALDFARCGWLTLLEAILTGIR